MQPHSRRIVRAIALAVFVCGLAGAAHAATFVVNSTLDTDDAAADGVCDDGAGHCTLRGAITEANRNAAADTIAFAIAGAGVHTISPATALPTISESITIDATTQPGYAGTPLVELTGGGTVANGLVLDYVGAPRTCSVRGLALYGFTNVAVGVYNACTIAANYVGLTAAGAAPANRNHVGLAVNSTSPVTIGGATTADRNVISANTNGSLSGGIVLPGAGTSGTHIIGNYIGTDPTGTAIIDTLQIGIGVNGNHVIESNLVSGNYTGIFLGSGASTVQNNLIGTDVGGTTLLGNQYGIEIFAGANTVTGNTVSGSSFVGIALDGGAGNVIAGNLIGTTASGTGSLANVVGVRLWGNLNDNTLGGDLGTARNIISGNGVGVSVQLQNFASASIIGNYIGLDASGAADGNNYGIELTGTTGGFTLGSTQSSMRNIISGNTIAGVHFAGTTQASGINLLGNYIGTSADGAAARPNGIGVLLDGAAHVNVGSAASGGGNVIAGNSGAGVSLVNNSQLCTIAGNSIGVGSGASAVSNQIGVLVDGNSHDNVIGGAGAAANIIRNSTQAGVVVQSGSNNRIQANAIDANGGLGIDLGGDGVTPNDAGDVDSGPNGLQNYPVLSLASSDGTNSWFTGTLASEPNKGYELEFFTSPTCDPSGNGEGATYVGSASVGTDASGNGAFTAFLPGATAGMVVTATAYENHSGTSEFSNCQPINSCPVITVTPATLTRATAGVLYSQQMTATGGTGSYTWAATYGVLPNGITVSSAGVLSGVTTNGGAYTFTITATDSAGCKGSTTYSLIVCGLNLLPASLPSGNTQMFYNWGVSASNGPAPWSYAVSSGAVPTGLTLNTSSGALTGTPTAGGTFNFDITASDANSCTATKSYAIAIADCSTLTVTPMMLPDAVVQTPYDQTVGGSGGGGTPYSTSLGAGTLPAGLTLSSNHVAGTPTTLGMSTFTVGVTDGSGCTASRDYTLHVTCPVITVTPSTLPGAQVGSAYSQTLGASGGSSPYYFEAIVGSLPDGLTLSSAGTLSGKPTVSGDFAFTVRASDTDSCPGQQDFTLHVADAAVADLAVGIGPDLGTADDLGEANGDDLASAPAPDLAGVTPTGGCSCNIASHGNGSPWWACCAIAIVMVSRSSRDRGRRRRDPRPPGP